MWYQLLDALGILDLIEFFGRGIQVLVGRDRTSGRLTRGAHIVAAIAVVGAMIAAIVAVAIYVFERIELF